MAQHSRQIVCYASLCSARKCARYCEESREHNENKQKARNSHSTRYSTYDNSCLKWTSKWLLRWVYARDELSLRNFASKATKTTSPRVSRPKNTQTKNELLHISSLLVTTTVQNQLTWISPLCNGIGCDGNGLSILDVHFFVLSFLFEFFLFLWHTAHHF